MEVFTLETNLRLNPLNNEDLEHIFISPKYFKITERIENIINKCTPGLTILSGDRGVGKSTAINYYVNRVKKKEKSNYLFFKMNMTNTNDRFFRDIFSYIETLNLDIEEINEETKKKLELQIKILGNTIYYNVVQEEITDSQSLLEREENGKSEFSGSIPFKIFNYKGIINKLKVSKTTDIDKTRIIKTKNFFKDDIQNRLIKLLNELSRYYKIFFILDELDKVEDEIFNNFILENKIIFLESSLSFICVIDKEKALNLKYENKLIDSIVREYIFYPSMEWSEFLVTASRMYLDISLNEIRELYFETRGNYRKLVNKHLFKESTYTRYIETNKLEAFFLYEYLMDSTYIHNLPILIKEFVKEFLFEVLKMYLLKGPLTTQELEKITLKYNNNILSPVFSKIKSEIQYFTGINSLSNFRNESIESEIQKYYQPKDIYYNMIHNKVRNYKVKNISTSELSDWEYIISVWIDSIDFVCICRQEEDSKDRDGFDRINYISYHCNIFVSNNYIEPIIFANSYGIAWIHELLSRKDKLFEFLKRKEIMFIEIELEKGVLNNEFLSSEINLKIVEQKILGKYDSRL